MRPVVAHLDRTEHPELHSPETVGHDDPDDEPLGGVGAFAATRSSPARTRPARPCRSVPPRRWPAATRSVAGLVRRDAHTVTGTVTPTIRAKARSRVVFTPAPPRAPRPVLEPGEVGALRHATHRREAIVVNRDTSGFDEPHRAQMQTLRRQHDRALRAIEEGVAAGRFSNGSPALGSFAFREMCVRVARRLRDDGPDDRGSGRRGVHGLLPAHRRGGPAPAAIPPSAAVVRPRPGPPRRRP